MKDKEKKVNEEVQTEEEGVELTDEELSSVAAGHDSFVNWLRTRCTNGKVGQ